MALRQRKGVDDDTDGAATTLKAMMLNGNALGIRSRSRQRWTFAVLDLIGMTSWRLVDDQRRKCQRRHVDWLRYWSMMMLEGGADSSQRSTGKKTQGPSDLALGFMHAEIRAGFSWFLMEDDNLVICL